MGSWLSKLMPDLGIFKNATIRSSCCNKIEKSISSSYTECIHCHSIHSKKEQEKSLEIKHE